MRDTCASLCVRLLGLEPLKYVIVCKRESPAVWSSGRHELTLGLLVSEERMEIKVDCVKDRQ